MTTTDLTAEDVERLVLDATLGRAPSVAGPEAADLFRRLRREVRAAARSGQIIQIPNEMPEMPPGEKGSRATP